MLTQDSLDLVQNRFNLLFRNTSDGVIITDRAAVLQRINPAAAAMLRITPESCLGQKPSALFRDMPALIDLLIGRGEAVRRVVLPAKRVALGISSELLDNNGRLIVLQDITERENLESRREQLITTLAHDLRNPVSAIIGFADLVSMYGDLNEDQKRFLLRISQTTKRIQTVINPLVDLAWVESGMPMQSIPVELDKLIHQAVADVNEKVHEKHSSVAISTQHPMPIVIGDPLRLQQVIYQLLLNAVQYSEPEHPIAVHAFTQNHELWCSVADRGIGIPNNEIDHVFDRMYRGESEWVRSVTGGGLGLTLARMIIKRHGGTIDVTSTVGRGSTFTFTLPLAS